MSKTDQDLLLYAGHRQRLRQKFMDDKLTGYEILELLLSYAIPRKDVRPLSRLLYKQFGTPHSILAAPIEELLKVPGLGQNTAVFIKAIATLMVESYRSEMKQTTIFTSKEALTNYCKIMIGGKPVEEMHVLYLDNAKRLLLDHVHSIGASDWTAVHPDEITRLALLLRAKSIVMIHNHPTPYTSFSNQDIEITTQIKNILNQLDIEIYDHYVISGDILYSMRESYCL